MAASPPGHGDTHRDFTVVVGVANPQHVDQLMRTAVDLAVDNDGEIFVVSVVHMHVTSPFALFPDERIKREFADDQEAVLDAAEAASVDAPVPVHRRLLVGTSVSGALRSAIVDVDGDALVLGWQDRSRPSDVVLGTTVDPVVRRAPCAVYIERVGTTADGMDAILLPTAGGPNVKAACELAGAVARVNDATVTVVSYVSPAAGTAARTAATENVDRAAESLPGAAVETAVEEADRVGEAIVSAAADHDLVVLGATEEWRVRRRVVGSVAKVVARRAGPPIVIAKGPSAQSLRERVLDWL